MTSIVIILIAAMSLSAEEKSPATAPAVAAPATTTKLPDSILKDYWHAIAAHHAQDAASLRAEASARQARESMVSIDKEIEVIRKKLQDTCGDNAKLNEDGPEPVCAPQEKNAKEAAPK
jgi:hypothetical protein